MLKFAYPSLLFLLCLSALFFSACEVDLKLDGIETQSKLVVNSLFSPDSIWIVHVSKSRNIFTDPVGIQDVEHANVIITDEGTGETFHLLYMRDGYYVNKFLSPVPGTKYNIEVAAEGFKTVYSMDETPYRITINFINEEFVEHLGDVVLKVEFEIVDRGGQENYYVWELIVTPLEDDENGESSVKDVTLIGSLDMNIDNGTNGEKVRHKLFITDSTFDGSSYSTSFFYTDPSVNDQNEENEDDVNILYQKQLKISVISKNYYLHLRSLELYENSRSISSTVSQPTEIYSNIENGFGIFGGFYQMSMDF